MDKKYQDIHVKIGSQNLVTIREIQLLSLIKEPKDIVIKYINYKDKEYTILIPILPYMEIIID